MSATAIGIDLGGTNLRVVLVAADGRRLAEHLGPVSATAAADALLAEVAARVRALRGTAQPVGVGVGLACALDARGRPIAGMTNLPSLAGHDVAADLAARLGAPVRLDNDARAAMLGEARFGAARTVRNALMITLGTGIGGGLLLDGRVRAGTNLLAGEIGLSRVPRSDASGGWTALEDLASPGGLKRTRGLDMADVFQRAAAGDAGARLEIDRVAERIAIAIVNAHLLVDLELVLIAGGMAKAGGALLGPIRERFANHCPEPFRSNLVIDSASLGDWAGAIGAAALWLAPEGNAV